MKKIEISEKTWRLLFVGLWGLLLCWRFFILFSYSYRYVDDDQAIMWYATVHFAHGHFPEPCFFGQDYNNMLEGLLAVPLYLCGWPLNYALPTVSSLLCTIPFIYCSVDCYRRKDKRSAFLVLFLFSLAAWQWDVLTSIPRPFVSAWAVIGAGLLCKPGNSGIKRALGCFLCAIGSVMTMAAAAILGIALLDYCLQYKNSWKKYLAPALGLIPAIAWYAFQKYYYSVHINDLITKSSVDPMQKEAFECSIGNLSDFIRETFSFGGSGTVIVPACIIIFAVIFSRKKQWRKLILLAVSVTGCVFTFSFGWMLVYEEGCILFGKSRLVMFWIYLLLELIMLFSFERENEWDQKYENPLRLGLVVLSAVFVCGKFLAFSKELDNTDSTLYRSGIVRVMSVDELRKQSMTILDVARLVNADVLVTTAYSSVMAYGSSALHYDEPFVFYVPDRDRRVWVYDELMAKKNSRLLLYSLPVDENLQIDVVELDELTVPGFFEQEYGITRGGEYNWGIR